jgi:carbon storage regulator
MLVLARKLNESIIIGNDVLVTVVEIRENLVRIGIDAPIHIKVDRLEVRNMKDRDQADGGPGPRRTGRED